MRFEKSHCGSISAFLGLLLLLTLPDPAWKLLAAEGSIAAIAIEGNEKTKERTILQEIGLRPGSAFNPAEVERDRQRIMDLGLFKSVATRIDDGEQGKVVVFIVEEKFYWLVWPRLSRTGDGDISYGLGARVDNLFGLNQHLELKIRRKTFNDTDLQEQRQYIVEYQYPRIFGSPWGVDFNIGREISQIDEQRGDLSGEYDRDLQQLGISFSRWQNTLGPSNGWNYSAGLFVQRYDHDFISGDPSLFFDADILALRLAIRYRKVNDFLFSRNGKEYGYESEISSSRLGSDVSYTKHYVYYRYYKKPHPDKHRNLNFQFRLGATNRSIFGDATYSLPSSQGLRGYSRDSIEGEAFLIGNVEYLRPVFKKDAFRLALFADAGNAYPKFEDIDISDLNYSVGFGFRWRIKALVKTDLRVDVARGLNDFGETRIYAATNATF